MEAIVARTLTIVSLVLLGTAVLALLFLTPHWNEFDIIDRDGAVAIQAAVVIAIGFIKVPVEWADQTATAIAGSVAAFAWMGLWMCFFAWAFAAWAIIGGGTDLTRWFMVFANYPLVSLLLGPAVVGYWELSIALDRDPT
jgi:hypothetical protein